MRVRLRNPDRVEVVSGPRTVASVLEELDLNPTTVLVIREGELVTDRTELADDDEIEVRPVISGGSGEPRCVVCCGPAVFEAPRHRSAWCGAHYTDWFHKQVRKAIDRGDPTSDDREPMFHYADRLLIAVSGGKDSLALWHALLVMGYRIDGLYVGLGIGGYSRRSGEVSRAFARRHAARRDLELIDVDMETEYGYTTPSGARAAQLATCRVCGLSKRHIFDREAVARGYDVVVTGHNLDDEAATLLNNVLRWQEDLLARQRPVLPATGASQVRKVKPLYRLTERETAAYCVVNGIDYVVEECPLVAGNTGQQLKDALSLLERSSPGVKAQFLFGFLDRAERFRDEATGDVAHLGTCDTCGMPTTRAVCAFCRQQRHILDALGRDREALPLARPSSARERERLTARLARRLPA